MATDDIVQTPILRAESRSRDAFDQITYGLGPRIASLVASQLGERLRGRIEAAHIRQDALIRALQSIGRFHGDSADSFMRWLARN